MNYSIIARYKVPLSVFIMLIFTPILVHCQVPEIMKFFENCHKNSSQFDNCIRIAFNDLRPFFKTGVPELRVSPFDPHRAKFVEQRRGVVNSLIGGYQLLLSDVSEFGWTNSKVTSYKTDAKNNRFIYSQDFPEKYLNGQYDFRAAILGTNVHTKGIWNMTLFDYAQTTTVTRVGGPGGLLKVRVEIDRLGNLQLKISDLFNGRKIAETAADFLINNVWQPGFPFLKPLINDLVSTAFTDIFNESFRYFPIENFIRN